MAARTATTATITAGEAGRPLDLATLLASVDQWTWMRMGVHANARGWLVGADHARHTLPGRRGMELVVKLAADDTYSLEIRRMVRLDWRVLGQRTGIYGDRLRETLGELYEAV